MRRFTSAPNPSERLRRYIWTRALSVEDSGGIGDLARSCRLGLYSTGEWTDLVGAVAVMDAVVAGQIAGGLAGGDDVVGGHGVLAVRQRNLLDLRPERLVDAHRLADRRFDLGVQPFAEMLAHQPQPQPSSGCRTVSV